MHDAFASPISSAYNLNASGRLDQNGAGAPVMSAAMKRDHVVSAAMAHMREEIESKVSVQQRLKHFDHEQANIREAGLTEARDLYSAQLAEKRQSNLRQREMAEALLDGELKKIRLAKLADKWLALQVRYVHLEELREREVAHRLRMKQKRQAFVMLIASLETRQQAERDELKKTQARIAHNLKKVQSLEMRSMIEVDRRRRAKEHEVAAHQLCLVQQKESEQLRELQLIKIKHMTEQLQREMEEFNALENLAQTSREAEFAIERRNQDDMRHASEKFDQEAAAIKANHLREQQKHAQGALDRRQRRAASFLDKQQRHAAKLRACAFLASDERLLQAVGMTFVDSNGADTSSDTASTVSDDSEISKDGEQDAMDGTDGAGRPGPDRGASSIQGLLEAQELDIIDHQRKSRERLKVLSRQQTENLTELKRQDRDNGRMMAKEHKRIMADLIKEQEEEVQAIRSDHEIEMQELISTMKRSNVIEAQHGQMDKQLDTDSSNGLLQQLLPPFVSKELKMGRIPEPAEFDFACVAFLGVSGFKELATRAGQGRILLKLLDKLYRCFDSILEQYPTLYKVETVLDTFVVASDSAGFSLDAMDVVNDIVVTHLGLASLVEWTTVPLCIGLNSGPCNAGVVGTKMVRYSLFGDTINLASRMCTTAEPLSIQMSPDFYAMVQTLPGYQFNERGQVAVKGKCEMTTWLASAAVEVEVGQI
ncbi:hypothetical protein BC828DRAFT_403349 [Blastocladiella britannica]|nr:hypothetical protein BC828DRAFT_403349 [Blastocladiella britannica]